MVTLGLPNQQWMPGHKKIPLAGYPSKDFSYAPFAGIIQIRFKGYFSALFREHPRKLFNCIIGVTVKTRFWVNLPSDLDSPDRACYSNLDLLAVTPQFSFAS
jgi:hypothetical protein